MPGKSAFLAALLALWVVIGAPPQGGGGSGLSTSGGTITGDLTVSGITSATVSGQVVDYSSSTTLVLTEAQCKGQVYRLTGSALQTITIPDAGASIDGTEPGFLVTFVCENTAGVKLQFGTGDTLATPAWTTATAGYLHSARSGSAVTFVRTAATTFQTTAITGTWRKDATTGAGFAFTPTPWTTFSSVSHSWDGDTDVSESGFYRHHGDVVDFRIRIVCAGQPANANLAIDTTACSPAFTADESKMVGIQATNQFTVVGRGEYQDSASAYIVSLCLLYTPSDNKCYAQSAGLTSNVANVAQAAPIAWDAGDDVAFTFSLPVQ